MACGGGAQWSKVRFVRAYVPPASRPRRCAPERLCPPRSGAEPGSEHVLLLCAVILLVASGPVPRGARPSRGGQTCGRQERCKAGRGGACGQGSTPRAGSWAGGRELAKWGMGAGLGSGPRWGWVSWLETRTS